MRTLTARQMGALARLGDLYAPGDADLPSFSSIGCVDHVHRLLAFLPEQDARDLATLLTALSFLPAGALRRFVQWTERSPRMSARHGSTLRTIRIGLRGIVMSLYYGDPEVVSAIGGEVRVVVPDERSVPDALPSMEPRGSP